MSGPVEGPRRMTPAMTDDNDGSGEKGETWEKCETWEKGGSWEKGGLTRRQFVKGTAVCAGILAAGLYPVASALASLASETPTAENVAINMPANSIWYAPAPSENRFAMVIDVKACIGCRKCVYACMKENNIGRDSGFTYIQVLQMPRGSLELEHGDLYYKQGASPDHWYLPIQCMQCGNPPCVQACPVKATWKESDEIVVIDYKKCIGCRVCMIACPYFARHFNWVDPSVPKNEINPAVPLHEKAGTVEKCTFCIHRAREGRNPYSGTSSRGIVTRCTEVCPVQARHFGDLNDPDSNVSRLLRTRRVFRLKEELGTEPRIWYVG